MAEKLSQMRGALGDMATIWNVVSVWDEISGPKMDCSVVSGHRGHSRGQKALWFRPPCDLEEPKAVGASAKDPKNWPSLWYATVYWAVITFLAS